MADAWFRFYNSAISDPKVQRLTPVLFRFWVNILCLASANGGELPSQVDMEFSLRLSQKNLVDLLDRLISAGLVDRTGETFRPHNWNVRQFKSDGSTERVKRFRERFKPVSETADETGPDTEQRQSRTETEKSKTSVAPLALTPILISFPTNRPNEIYEVRQKDFDQFQALYPAADVAQELRSMAGWLISNPKNVKTKAGTPRFINSWLSKAQNRSKPNGHGKPSKNDNWLAGAAALNKTLGADEGPD